MAQPLAFVQQRSAQPAEPPVGPYERLELRAEGLQLNQLGLRWAGGGSMAAAGPALLLGLLLWGHPPAFSVQPLPAGDPIVTEVADEFVTGAWNLVVPASG